MAAAASYVKYALHDRKTEQRRLFMCRLLNVLVGAFIAILLAAGGAYAADSTQLYPDS